MKVTRLRERGDRVEVELDGRPWRVLPAAAVAGAGLRVGLAPDRQRLRLLRHELRRAEALEAAGRLLARRDLSRSDLRDRLVRGGLAPAPVEEALTRLEAMGLIEDGVVAQRRAAELAGRGYGDDAIAADLERRGICAEALEEALNALQPERDRAREAAAAGGATLATARRLVRRGFSEDSVEAALPDLVAKGGFDR